MYSQKHRKTSDWFLLTAVVAACNMLLVAPSRADNYRSAPSSSVGTWSAISDWQIQIDSGQWETPAEEHGVPGAGDDVLIRDHRMIVDDDVTIQSLAIEQDGLVTYDYQKEQDLTLTITAAGGLRLDAATTGGYPGTLDVPDTFTSPPYDRFLRLTGGAAAQSMIDGWLSITGPSAALLIESDTILGGGGQVVLENDYAAIVIGESRRLTIGPSLTVCGYGRIVSATAGNAVLKNTGTLVANIAGGILELGPRIVPEDAPRAQWVASEPSSILEISIAQTPPCLSGDFTVVNGSNILMHSRIYTSGSFNCINGGTVGLLYYKCDCDDPGNSCMKAGGC